MIHRGIATLALTLMMCFLVLSHYDPQFFLLHFYESLIYLAIVVMLFYFEDRWAYMLGILAPAAWLLLTFISGGMPGIVRQAGLLLRLQRPDFAANVLGALAVALSVLMIIVCARRWRREFAGTGKGWSTFLPSLGVIVVYYGVLLVFILRGM